MVDHLQSHVTPWRQYTSHVKVRGTLSKMDVWMPEFSPRKSGYAIQGRGKLITARCQIFKKGKTLTVYVRKKLNISLMIVLN